MREYELSVGEHDILLRSGEGEWHIPVCDLIRFSLSGPSVAPDRFTIRTKNGSYDGRFANTEDAKEVMNQLSKHGGQNLEINLTTG